MPRNRVLEELLGVSPQQLLKANTVKQDRYDVRLYQELLDASAELRNLAKQGTDTWPALLRDIWAAFYKASPELVPEEQINPAHLANRVLTERLLEDTTTAETRLVTVLDELSAGTATLETGRRLRDEIQKSPELREAVRKAEQILQVQEDEAKAQALADEVQQILQQAARDLRRAVRIAVRAGQDKAQEVLQVLAGWGIEPADLRRVPLEERIRLVQRLTDPNVRKLADLIGCLRNLARARQKERLKHGRDEIHGITLGDDLGRVLPAELVMLKQPLRKLDFYRRLTERQLLQYELRTREPQGRGPMVILVDASDSMSISFGTGGLTRMDWASAVALALVDTAIRQKRRATVVHFNYKIVQQVAFRPGERDALRIADVASVKADGGTDYQIPLTRALDLISTAEYNKADVVMITDGECQIRAEFLAQFQEQKRQRDFRCWTVLISPSFQWSKASVQGWSDKMWAVSGLTGDQVAGELFEVVAS